MPFNAWSISILCLVGTVPAMAVPPPAAVGAASTVWDRQAAAAYLDQREVWWQEWPHAQKDHGTVCISCHTQVPYALARTEMHRAAGEAKLADPERAMLGSILTRIELGDKAETFYSDAVHGPGKTREARNTESVFNALILASYDAAGMLPQGAAITRVQTPGGGHISSATRTALDRMWASQEKTGAKAGAWIWQDFHFSPWEAPESEYYGATMAAVAAGTAYRGEAQARPAVELLRGYLQREFVNQPLANKALLLWASSKMGRLISDLERQALVDGLLAKQDSDGGWSLAGLGATPAGQMLWKRRDQSPFVLRSDGYATGLIVLALESTSRVSAADGTNSDQAAVREAQAIERGLAWLSANQDEKNGEWPAWSLNVKRDPDSGVGKFMSDAATGFAVLALEASRARAVDRRVTSAGH